MLPGRIAGIPLFFLLFLGGCGLVPAREAQAPDSTAAAPVPDLPAEEPVERLHPEVRRACGAVTEYWRSEPRIQVRAFDSVLTLPRSASVTDACWVTVRLEDDRGVHLREPDRQRIPFVASGWLPVYEFDADGPDGGSRVYQLDPVRCLAEERWDGGDDRDSTYVPAPWFEQRVACWRRSPRD